MTDEKTSGPKIKPITDRVKTSAGRVKTSAGRGKTSADRVKTSDDRVKTSDGPVKFVAAKPGWLQPLSGWARRIIPRGWTGRVSFKTLAKWYYAGVAVVALAALVTMLAVYRVQVAQLRAGMKAGQSGQTAEKDQASESTQPTGTAPEPATSESPANTPSTTSTSTPPTTSTAPPTSDATPPPAATPTATPPPAAGSEPAAPSTAAPDLKTMSAPAEGSTLVTYGWVFSKTLQDWRFHAGVDIGAAQGSPVRAALPGRVISADQDARLGQQVIIDHGAGVQTVYACLQEKAVAVGDDVEQGQYLGKIGATALMESADGPHLHFAITKQGESVDPRPYLK